MKRLTLCIFFPTILLLALYANTEEVKPITSKIHIDQCLLQNKKARPRKPLRIIKGIIIHGTGNFKPDADADYNRKYFELGLKRASYHYLVDSEKTVQLIPLDEVALHCGGLQYTKYGKLLHFDGQSPNYSTIGIGMCMNRDYETVRLRTQQLIAKIWSEHGQIPLFRHADITGKRCPEKLVDGELVLIDGVEWEVFKEEVLGYYEANYK